MTGDLYITPFKCPFCIGGLAAVYEGGTERCHHCSAYGLTNDPCGDADRAPRPPGVMRTPCADCAFRPGSPELDNAGAQLPDDEPFFCHQGLPVNAAGAYTPVATFRGLPLGAMVCAGWWALKTGEPLATAPYREIPITEDEVDKRWGPPKAFTDAIHTLNDQAQRPETQPPADPWSISYHQLSPARLNADMCTCGLGPDNVVHNEPPHRFNGRPKPGMQPVHGICTTCHHHQTAACHTTDN